MRKWLLIATRGDSLGSLGTASVETFTSGDGDEPEPGDLGPAALDLAARTERRGGTPPGDRLEAVLVPLNEARTVTFSLDRKATIVSTGGPV